jgi:endonuclease YncB( thermonuclease family)
MVPGWSQLTAVCGILLLVFYSGLPAAKALVFEPQVAVVTRVMDGDTLVLRFPDAPQRPRVEYRANLLGVDAPGRGEAECAAAYVADIAHRLLQGRRVWVEWDSRDRRTGDGRLLVYIHHLDERDADLNATYIEQGWGWVPRAYPADRKAQYLKLEQQARAAQRGLWGMACAPAMRHPPRSGQIAASVG